MHSEDRYRRAAAASGVGIWNWNLATSELYVDPILKEMLGYEDREIRNHLDDWGRLVHPDDAAAVFELARAHIAGEAPVYEIEHRMLHRNGSVRWFLARGSVIRDAEGRATHITGTDTDITARKLGEEALRKAEEVHKRIVDSTNDCVKILDLEGRVLHVNREGLNLLEVPDVAALKNRPIDEFFEGALRLAAQEAVAAARGGGSGRFQGPLRTPSGITRWWDIVVTPITDGGAVTQLLAVSRDITDRRRDEAFRAAQLRMLEIIAADGTLSDALDHLVRVVEQHAGGMLCSVLLLDDDGIHMRHGAAPSLPPDYVRAIDGLAIGPRVGSCGTAMHLADRVVVTDIVTDPLWDDYREAARHAGLRACWSQPIFSPRRRVLGAFAMYYGEPRAPRDQELRLIESAAHVARIAIEQHRSHQALRRSEARNRAILRAIPDWMFLMTVDGVFLDYHAKDVSRLHAAPSSFLGKNVRDVLPPPAGEALARAVARVTTSDEPEKVEYSLTSDNVQRFYEACIVGCDGDKVLSIVRDVTDRKRAEIEAGAQRLELAHLSRVAVLGELTGTLAHELSQPLTAVLSNAQAARRLLDRSPVDAAELKDALDDIIKNNRRAGAVIDRLRALLRKEDAPRQLVNLNDLAREVVELAHGELLLHHVTVTNALMPEAPVVRGDRVQLQQVVLNLVLNACDAMTNTPVPERQLVLGTRAENGFVELLVSDHGVGIPKGDLERVFEPFVSFRKRGLGLGLTISRSIVDAHEGSIRAENNADGGATFRCFFPVVDARALEQTG
jgi:PAS domain S-box-containing protein